MAASTNGSGSGTDPGLVGRSRQRRTMTAVTLTDVARSAGVSLATASRVLNGSARTPAADIATRVRASAQELGYVANAQAQALARSATGLVGLVVHDIVDPYFAMITRGAQRYARSRRSQVLLAGADRSEKAELQAVAALVSYRADAIVLAGSRRSRSDQELSTELGRYTANGGRVVTLGRSTIPGAVHLEIGHKAGAADLVTTLVGRGVRRFVILAGPPGLNTARQRVQGYQSALKQAGLEPLRVVNGDFNREGGLTSVLTCLDQIRTAGPDRVCVLAVNDVMALGAIAGLRSVGLAVPDDALVAGFDDIPTLLDFTPGLTTVRLPLEMIGEQAVALAFDHDDRRSLKITGETVVRESTG